tara:strand:+ start:1350 stop:1613 length:264 start_codon:yes stop_codon:yes gene_type:complete
MKYNSQKIIEDLRKSSQSMFNNKKLMLRAADLIEHLCDERDSAWDMLDEIKKSELENFQSMLKTTQLKHDIEASLKNYAGNKKDGTN